MKNFNANLLLVETFKTIEEEALFLIKNGSDSDLIKNTLFQLYWILKKKYGEPIGYGRSRVVFQSRTNVIKLPLNDIGISANGIEVTNYECEYDFPIAKCKLVLVWGIMIPIVIMEKIDLSLIPYNQRPVWSSLVDCCQIGKDRKGNIVAYDAA